VDRRRDLGEALVHAAPRERALLAAQREEVEIVLLDDPVPAVDLVARIVTSGTMRDAAAFANATCAAEAAPRSSAPSASNARWRLAATLIDMFAAWCLTAWKLPIGRPNASRIDAYATVWSSACAADPTHWSAANARPSWSSSAAAAGPATRSARAPS
jgi:hypothetical protein